MEGDDDGHHIVAVDSAVDATAVKTIDSSSGSDDIQMTLTLSSIDKIWDRTDAMLNQQTFDVTLTRPAFVIRVPMWFIF